jgi:hypothetical protein
MANPGQARNSSRRGVTRNPPAEHRGHWFSASPSQRRYASLARNRLTLLLASFSAVVAASVTSLRFAVTVIACSSNTLSKGCGLRALNVAFLIICCVSCRARWSLSLISASSNDVDASKAKACSTETSTSTRDVYSLIDMLRPTSACSARSTSDPTEICLPLVIPNRETFASAIVRRVASAPITPTTVRCEAYASCARSSLRRRLSASVAFRVTHTVTKASTTVARVSANVQKDVGSSGRQRSPSGGRWVTRGTGLSNSCPSAVPARLLVTNRAMVRWGNSIVVGARSRSS